MRCKLDMYTIIPSSTMFVVREWKKDMHLSVAKRQRRMRSLVCKGGPPPQGKEEGN